VGGKPSFGESKKVEVVVVDNFLDASWFIYGGSDGGGGANVEAGKLERGGDGARVDFNVASKKEEEGEKKT
jgi:hypothetical protein